MARWDPGAEERLRTAALELYLERGYDAVTATDIAERAGLTRRTFHRYFADKREVLFGDMELLAGVVAQVVRDVDPAVPPAGTVLQAVGEVGTWLAEHTDHVRERRAIIAGSPELQERERTKLAAVSSAATAALRERGVSAATAELLGQIGTAVFRSAFQRWVEHDGELDFRQCLAETEADLRGALL